MFIMQYYHDLWKGNAVPLYICLFFIFFLLIPGCRQKNNENYQSPAEYDLNQPATKKLPGYLDEISGIAYYQKDKTVFAISDEKGWLYKIFFSGRNTIQKWKYASGSDFEDLVLADSTFYVLQSNGDIHSYKFITPDSAISKTYAFPLRKGNEFEILYLDKDQHRLIMLCKDCVADDKNSVRAWAFDLSNFKFSPNPAYIIDVRKIAAMLRGKKEKFKPSAAAIQPGTGRLFIISSINKALVIADQNGNPESVYKLNPRIYKQPEGLTFTPEGHLIISNESADIGAANILMFKYNRP